MPPSWGRPLSTAEGGKGHGRKSRQERPITPVDCHKPSALHSQTIPACRDKISFVFVASNVQIAKGHKSRWSLEKDSNPEVWLKVRLPFGLKDSLNVPWLYWQTQTPPDCDGEAAERSWHRERKRLRGEWETEKGVRGDAGGGGGCCHIWTRGANQRRKGVSRVIGRWWDSRRDRHTADERWNLSVNNAKSCCSTPARPCIYCARMAPLLPCA